MIYPAILTFEVDGDARADEVWRLLENIIASEVGLNNFGLSTFEGHPEMPLFQILQRPLEVDDGESNVES